MNSPIEEKSNTHWRVRLHEIIFEADTPEGKGFDIALIWAILLSILFVVLESVKEIRDEYGQILYFGEWFFTIVFTIEIILRMIAVKHPLRYLFSFYGVVDLLAVIPTYLSFFIPGAQSLLVIRTFRLLRIFRILKLSVYLNESQVLYNALRSSRHKIFVFLMVVVSIMITMGAIMYVVEGEKNGFTNIPRSMYWAVVTMTTVGYGDIAPQTNFGQFLASCLMILGYGIIAVPTGIVTQEFVTQARNNKISGQACPSCGFQSHDMDAIYCKRCGGKL